MFLHLGSALTPPAEWTYKGPPLIPPSFDVDFTSIRPDQGRDLLLTLIQP